MIRRCKLTALVASATLFIGHVGAATVSSESGTVLISNGSGFVPIEGNTEAPAGAQVMVQPGGIALIVYSGGCTVRVGPGEVRVVEEKPPCSPARAADIQTA
jgi:hypothetical protein